MLRIHVAACASALVVFAAGMRIDSARSQEARLSLHATRTSPFDLEVGGDVAGVARGSTRYVTREDLLAISRRMTIATDDGNFKDTTMVRGLRVEDLFHALGVPPNDMAIADCKDRYEAHYPRAYVAAHHPVLVMEANGMPLSNLSKGAEGDDPGPYLIAHEKFKPAFKVLSAPDEPQIPWGVVRLEFRDEKEVFGAIAPRGSHSGDVPVQDGFKIARQNCFRCHNNAAEGGLKSGVTWTVLAALAAGSPDFFAAYVRDPAAKNPKTQMAASPEYDEATMQALAAYFRTFAPVKEE